LCIAVSFAPARHQTITGASPDDHRRVTRSRPDESTLEPGPGFLFESMGSKKLKVFFRRSITLVVEVESHSSDLDSKPGA
jgi:hypothetical protein